MSYDETILRRARERFETERMERRRTLEGRRENAYHRQPRLREIEQELRKTSGQVLAAALRRGADPQKAVEELRKRNLSLQDEKKTLLKQMGLSADYLSEQPACPVCQDSGYLDNGRMCQCLLNYCAKEQRKELSKMLDLGTQSFDSFSLRHYSTRIDHEQGYSPRAYMEGVYKYCKNYACHFRPQMGNLLFYGSTGLGKTFLSAAIAREVSAAGFSVVYDTAAHIFRQFEAEKFDRSEGADRDVSRILRCDLLILDDLGTEMRTAFTISALYQIINSRLLERRATIINTNLEIDDSFEPDEFSEYYSAPIVSRIKGEYKIFHFFGDDIRQKLREGRDGQSPL